MRVLNDQYTDAICNAIMDMDIDRGGEGSMLRYDIDTEDEATLEISCTISDNITSHYKSNGITPEEWHGYRDISNLIVDYVDTEGAIVIVDTAKALEIEQSINEKLRKQWKY